MIKCNKLEKLNGKIESYVSSAGDNNDDGDDEEDHSDDKSETWQPVDKDARHNELTDNDHCDNLVEEMMTT